MNGSKTCFTNQTNGQVSSPQGLDVDKQVTFMKGQKGGDCVSVPGILGFGLRRWAETLDGLEK
jgi:hypothetical protein